MKKTVEQLLAAAKAKADAQAAAAQGAAAVTAAANSPANPAAPAAAATDPATATAAGPKDGEKPGEPAATAPNAAFVIEGGKVFINADQVKDGVFSAKVEDKDGKFAIAGLSIPAAEQPKDISALATELGAMAVARSAAEAEVTELEGQLAVCVGIVSASLDKMNIALGSAKVDVSKLGVSELIAQHTAVSAQFAAKFPVGGVAAVAASQEPTKKTDVSTEQREFMSRVSAINPKVQSAQ